MGDMTYEHPQNVTLSQIIVANEGIVQASQAQQPPDSSEEDAEVRHQLSFSWNSCVSSANCCPSVPYSLQAADMRPAAHLLHTLQGKRQRCSHSGGHQHWLLALKCLPTLICSCCRGAGPGRHDNLSQCGPAVVLAPGACCRQVSCWQLLQLQRHQSCASCLQAFRKDMAGRTLKLWLDLQTAVSALYDSSLGSKYADKAPVS